MERKKDSLIAGTTALVAFQLKEIYIAPIWRAMENKSVSILAKHLVHGRLRNRC